eukprot:6476080-Amphidinium_carterae.2
MGQHQLRFGCVFVRTILWSQEIVIWQFWVTVLRWNNRQYAAEAITEESEKRTRSNKTLQGIYLLLGVLTFVSFISADLIGRLVVTLVN